MVRLGSRKFPPDPDWYLLVPWLISRSSIEEVAARPWGPKKGPACLKAEPETPKKLEPEKAADLQQSKPFQNEKSSPARKTTAKQPEKGQRREPAEGEHQEPAQGHERQQKEKVCQHPVSQPGKT